MIDHGAVRIGFRTLAVGPVVTSISSTWQPNGSPVAAGAGLAPTQSYKATMAQRSIRGRSGRTDCLFVKARFSVPMLPVRMPPA